jgi:hypothetical protein
MTLHLQQSVFIAGGEAGTMPASASNMLALSFRKSVFDASRTRVRHAQGSTTILVALAGMLPASHLGLTITEHE